MKTLQKTSLFTAAMTIACAACGGAVEPSATRSGTSAASIESSDGGATTTYDDAGASATDGGTASLVVPPPPPIPPNSCHPALQSDGGAFPQLDAGAYQGPEPAPPSASDVVAYRTAAQFEALAVGRWARSDGPPELQNEVLGVELSADHGLFALRRAADGSIERLPPDGLGVQSWSLDLDDPCAGPQLIFRSAGAAAESTYAIGAPVFSGGGAGMYLLYAPWPASYTRIAQ